VDSRELESAVIAQKAVHLSQQFTKFKTAKSIIYIKDSFLPHWLVLESGDLSGCSWVLVLEDLRELGSAVL